MVFAALAAATLVSEDLACAAAGVLVRNGEIGFVAATLACALGILAGDIGLWGLGRGAAVFGARSPRLGRWLSRLPLAPAGAWLERHAAAAMIASRFTPGTRLPLYVGAGAAGMPLASFSAWAAVAVLIWTPAVVWAASGAHQAVNVVLPGGRWPSSLATIVVLGLALKALPPLTRHARRVRLEPSHPAGRRQ
jgi:membrane protein DedA with SNARE-associated domain